MYPSACDYLSKRRQYLIDECKYNNATYIPTYYITLQAKFQRIYHLPTSTPLNWLVWLNIMEVLVCYTAHSIPLPDGITAADVADTVWRLIIHLLYT